MREKSNPKSLLNFANEEVILPESWSKESLLDISNYIKIYQKRLLKVEEDMTSYMIELKGSTDLSTIDIWNKSQGFYGKKLSFLYSKILFIKTISSI